MVEDEDRPPWDEDLAAELIGAHVLVGFTRLTHTGEVKSREQFHGVVVSADRQQGICIAWQGEHVGEHYWLPPMTDAFKPLPPGKYELMSTGEIVEDPAFKTTWTITEPPPDW
jgi:hypothetical protein